MNADALPANVMDAAACPAANDVFVMDAWGTAGGPAR